MLSHRQIEAIKLLDPTAPVGVAVHVSRQPVYVLMRAGTVLDAYQCPRTTGECIRTLASYGLQVRAAKQEEILSAFQDRKAYRELTPAEMQSLGL